MKIAVCDDDLLCRQQIAAAVQGYFGSRDVALSVFSRGSALLEETAKTGGFDLYILDVLMPEINGIQLGMRLRQMGDTGKIVFLTSSPDYALDAFRAMATDYLLKPVTQESISAVLDRILPAVSAQKSKSLILRTKESAIHIDFDTLLYTELVKKTVVYHLVGGREVESMSIRSTFSEAMQELLRDSRFALCGSGRMVNLHHISELNSEYLVFKTGETLHIGKRASRVLRSAWYDFWFEGENSK